MADELIIKKETAEGIAEAIREGLDPETAHRVITGDNFAEKILEGLSYQRFKGKEEGENLHANDYNNGYTKGLEEGKKNGIAEEEENIQSVLVHVEGYHDSDFPTTFSGYSLTKNPVTSKYEVVQQDYTIEAYGYADGYFLPYTPFTSTNSIHTSIHVQAGWTIENNMIIPDKY